MRPRSAIYPLTGYTAQQTLEYTQRLYELKLVTYPRTDSRYLTGDMSDSTRKLIDTLLERDVFDSIITSDYATESIRIGHVINNAKVTDHHAIIPTGSVTSDIMDSLPGGEKNILLLIAYRLISAVYTPHRYAAAKLEFSIEGECFTAAGKEIIDNGYRFIEDRLKKTLSPASDETEDTAEMIPQLSENSVVDVRDISAKEKKTQPPKHFTEDTLLSAMETAGQRDAAPNAGFAGDDGYEHSGLGTPATRAEIIEKIIKTGYILRDGKKLLPTEIAVKFIDIVTTELTKPELTAKWEKQLMEIQLGKLSYDTFLNEISGFIRLIVGREKETSPALNTEIFNKRKVCQRQ